jgi:hypothetical protein
LGRHRCGGGWITIDQPGNSWDILDEIYGSYPDNKQQCQGKYDKNDGPSLWTHNDLFPPVFVEALGPRVAHYIMGQVTRQSCEGVKAKDEADLAPVKDWTTSPELFGLPIEMGYNTPRNATRQEIERHEGYD